MIPIVCLFLDLRKSVIANFYSFVAIDPRLNHNVRANVPQGAAGNPTPTKHAYAEIFCPNLFSNIELKRSQIYFSLSPHQVCEVKFILVFDKKAHVKKGTATLRRPPQAPADAL